MTIVGTLVLALVVALLVIAARRTSASTNRWGGRRLVVVGGIVLPVAVIVPLMVLTVVELNDEPVDDGALEVEVVGHRWWWEVRYGELGIVDANELHLPVDRDVVVELRSGDVIHSFWVPPLAGKMDLVPGTTNTLRLRATETGTVGSPGTELEFAL